MAEYQVVRVQFQSCANRPTQLCATAVATGNPTIYDQVWSADQVSAAIGAGDRFFTQEQTDGKTAAVCCTTCPICKEKTVLVSEPESAPSLDIARLPRL